MAHFQILASDGKTLVQEFDVPAPKVIATYCRLSANWNGRCPHILVDGICICHIAELVDAQLHIPRGEVPLEPEGE